MTENLCGPGEAAMNTDRHLWPETSDPDAPTESIHVTAGGGIGINIGGLVIVKPLREWHALAQAAIEPSLYHVATLWLTLLQDCDAKPCKYPDLRDAVADWSRDHKAAMSVGKNYPKQGNGSLRDAVHSEIKRGMK